jgi:hypothetical protein
VPPPCARLHRKLLYTGGTVTFLGLAGGASALRAGAGDVVLAQPETFHGFGNEGDEEARLVSISVPEHQRFFDAVAGADRKAPFAAMEPAVAMQRVAAIGAEPAPCSLRQVAANGCGVVGPPHSIRLMPSGIDAAHRHRRSSRTCVPWRLPCGRPGIPPKGRRQATLQRLPFGDRDDAPCHRRADRERRGNPRARAGRQGASLRARRSRRSPRLVRRPAPPGRAGRQLLSRRLVLLLQHGAAGAPGVVARTPEANFARWTRSWASTFIRRCKPSRLCRPT